MTDMAARLDAIQGATVSDAPQPYHKLNRQQLLTLCIALEDQRDRALDLARKQQAAIDAVREVHEHRFGTYIDHNGQGWSGDYCSECRVEWPCETIGAIDVTFD